MGRDVRWMRYTYMFFLFIFMIRTLFVREQEETRSNCGPRAISVVLAKSKRGIVSVCIHICSCVVFLFPKSWISLEASVFPCACVCAFRERTASTNYQQEVSVVV